MLHNNVAAASMLLIGCHLGLYAIISTEKLKACVCREATSSAELSLRHAFTLAMSHTESTPRSTIYIRLLGPFTARQAFLVTASDINSHQRKKDLVMSSMSCCTRLLLCQHLYLCETCMHAVLVDVDVVSATVTSQQGTDF